MKEPLLIIALPYAGGDKYAYRSLEREKPDWIEFVSLELPGRGMRRKEAQIGTMDEIAADYLQQLRSLKLSKAFILFGHSMGALAAFEMLRKMSLAGDPLPSFAYLSGCQAPCVFEARKIVHLPAEEFWQEIKKLGGTPEQLFAYPELLNMFEPIFKNDFRALELYRYESLAMPVNTAVHIRWGSREPHHQEKFEQWRSDLNVVSLNQMHGGHFYLFEKAKEIWDDISQIHQQNHQEGGE